MFQVFYDADTGNGGTGEGTDNQDDKGTGADPNNTEKTIPYERFKTVNDNYKEVKKQLDALVKQQEQVELETKEKQGEFETLYNELKEKHEPISNEFQLYKDTFQEILKAKLETVPENMRDLIPQGNELEQLKWIENATAKGLFNKGNPQSFGNGGTNPDTSNENKTNKGFLKGLSRFNK